MEKIWGGFGQTPRCSTQDSGAANCHAIAVADPVRIRLSEPTGTLGHIEIRKLEGDQPLVTAIEVISPTNKLDARNRRRYLQKRDAYYAAGVNVVEIDLIRAGEPLIDVPWERVKPHQLTPYRAAIRRVPAPDEDLEAEYYPLPLQSRLPALAIPLRRGTRTSSSTCSSRSTGRMRWGGTGCGWTTSRRRRGRG